MSEYFFIPKPIDTGGRRLTPLGSSYPVYRDVSDNEAFWSNVDLPLPSVGDRVYLAINSIGYGRVEGYCISHGFLGVIAKPEDPPGWFTHQRRNMAQESVAAAKLTVREREAQRIRVWPKWLLDGACVVFGAELRLQK
jgi:hypothetical protein